MDQESRLILPYGSSAEKRSPGPVTERSAIRRQEDQDFVPVIVKRNDEARRHPDDILERAIIEGLEQLERPFLSLGLSSGEGATLNNVTF